jgi:hypothetical protein
VLAVLPLSAVFILFDIIIHNPNHTESRTNLSILDKAAGYFSLLSLGVGDALPADVPVELTRIAREYYWKTQNEAALPMMAKHSLVSAQGTDSDDNPMTDLQQVVNNEAISMGLGLDPQMMSDPLLQLNYPTPMDFSNQWYFPDWYMDGGQED